jgi:hypothetical protein
VIRSGRRLVRALSRNVAETAPDADDPRLRTRTYAIPFDDVWRAALAMADGGLRGWRVIAADDQDGSIVAEAVTPVFRFVDDVRIRIVLDDNAQTCVDLHSASRVGRADLGANARRIARFLGRLDARLQALPPRPLPGPGPSARSDPAGR